MRFQFANRKKQAGLTIMELMVALGLSALLLAILMLVVSYSARRYLATGNYAALDQASRRALDDLKLQIREADGVLACTTNRLDLSYHAGTLTYSYDAETKPLSRTWLGTTTPILQGCEKL